MPDQPPDDKTDPKAILAGAHLCLFAAHTEDLFAISWDEPDAVALAEKRGRILAAVQSSLSKIDVVTNDDDPISPEHRAEAERELERRLLRLRDGLRRARRARGGGDTATGPGVGRVYLAKMGTPGPDGAGG